MLGCFRNQNPLFVKVFDVATNDIFKVSPCSPCCDGATAGEMGCARQDAISKVRLCCPAVMTQQIEGWAVCTTGRRWGFRVEGFRVLAPRCPVHM